MSAVLRPHAADLRLPDVWRVPDLGRQELALSTGHPALDKELPGGGWPVGSLVEVLQAQPDCHAWQLPLPALVRMAAEHPGPVVVVGAPQEPFGPSLRAQGLPPERLLCVKAEKPAARLWAAEQALRCGDVIAVLAWLPRARDAELRRLHLAASLQGKLLFVYRGLRSRADASPARLRLWVEGVDEMRVHLLKRRGPPMQAPVSLPAHPPRLAALMAARQSSGVTRVDGPLPIEIPALLSHALDRTEAVAG